MYPLSFILTTVIPSPSETSTYSFFCELKYRLNNSLNSSATSTESVATPLKFLLMIRGSKSSSFPHR